MYLRRCHLAAVIITFAAGIFALSIGLLDEVAPLDATTADKSLFAGWGFLAATVVGGLTFIVLTGLIRRSFYEQLMSAAQGRSEEEEHVNIIARMLRFGWLRDLTMAFTIFCLIGALGFLGGYVAVSTSEETPLVSNVEVKQTTFTEDLREPGPCLATLDLMMPEETADLTIYTAIDGILTTNAQQVTLQRSPAGDEEPSVCVAFPWELEDIDPGPIEIELLVDKSPTFLHDEVVSGSISSIRDQVEYIDRYPTIVPPRN